MAEPKLSIVVPVYNRAAIVEKTLDSIAAQTLRPLSLILVDNNSTDGSLAVLEKWANSHRSGDFNIQVLKETTPGPGAARNAGLDAVVTDWAMFFDSDDLMSPDHCARAMATAEANPQAGVVGWDLWLPGPGGASRYRPFVTKDMVRANIFESIFSTQHYMARTQLLRRAGGWSTAGSVAEDAELGNRILMLHPVCVRMESRGETVTVVPAPESLMRGFAGTLAALEPALEAIRLQLPEKQRHWIDLQYICAACGWAASDAQGQVKVKNMISRQPFFRRILFRMFYYYGRGGGRGIGRIYRLITPEK